MSILSTLQGGLDKIWALRRTNEKRYPSERLIPYSGRTQAGVYITPDRALMNDTVWAAHRYLTQTVAQLPARIIKKTPKGNEIINQHPVDSVLNWRTNPELSPFQFKETMVGWAVLHGNGVAEIELDGAGRVKWLWPIFPDRIQFLRDVETQELIYRINQGEKGSVDLRPDQVFHLRGFGNGPIGLSVVEYAAQSIGWARAAELFSASFFGEGMHFGGTIISENKMDDKSVERLREELNQVYKGPNRAGKWFIGDGNLKVTNTTSTAREAQFVPTLQHQVELICRFMGVPPHKVHHLLRMTYNNVEQMSIDVVGDSIVPWVARFEQEASYKLFGLNRGNLEVKLEVKGLLRGSQKDRQEALAIQFRHGVINGNFWADIEDQPRPEKGEIYYIEGNNMVPVDKLDEILEKKSKPLVPAPAPAPSKQDNIDVDSDPDAMAALLEIYLILNPELVHAE
jgi:HK97 family phage portal protein